jgi:hypothetical protein
VRRIDRGLLPFSLHSTARAKSGTAAELEDMLGAAGSPAEAAIIRAELAQVWVLTPCLRTPTERPKGVESLAVSAHEPWHSCIAQITFVLGTCDGRNCGIRRRQ